MIDLTVFNREKNVSRKRWDWISMLIIVIAIRRLSIWFPSL